MFRRGTFRWWELNLVPGTIEHSFAGPLAAGRADLAGLGRRTIMYLTEMVAGINPPQTEEASDALEHFAHVFSTGATVIHSTRDRGEVNAELEEAKHLVHRVDEEGSRCCASRPAGRRRPHGGWRHTVDAELVLVAHHGDQHVTR